MNKQSLIYIAIGAAVVALLWYIFRDRSVYIEDVKKAIKSREKQGEKPSFASPVYKGAANSIYESLRYSAVSDDKERAVQTIIGVTKNDLDFYSLITAFGLRQEFAFGLPVGDKKDLTTFLTSNLSDGQLNKINIHFESKGMDTRI